MSIDTLVHQIRQATDFQKNKIRLREQVENDLLIPHGDGMFRASPELISFLAVWDQDELYIEDVYHNPIKCNREQLLESCKQQYQKVMNRWHNQHEQIQRARKV